MARRIFLTSCDTRDEARAQRDVFAAELRQHAMTDLYSIGYEQVRGGCFLIFVYPRGPQDHDQ